MIVFLAEVLTKTSGMACVGAKSAQDPRAVGSSGWSAGQAHWSGRNASPGHTGSAAGGAVCLGQAASPSDSSQRF